MSDKANYILIGS